VLHELVNLCWKVTERRFEVFRAVKVEIVAFWTLTLFTLVDGDKCS